jgi:hypothetical protein
LAKSRPAAPPAEAKPEPGLDVSSVAPWVLFWGWVALDSALAYRKSQAALEETAQAEPATPAPEPAPKVERRIRRWLPSSPLCPEGLRAVQKRAKTAMIGAPIMAVLGTLVLGKFLRRNKS